MKWCSSCVLPDTRPNLSIGEDGVCNACKSHGTKRDIDWTSRAEQLRSVVDWAKQSASPTGYDCVIPVSGGKDSTWQTICCLKLGLRPLAVTWKTPARTAIGQQNLDNLISLGVDHIDYRINPKVEAHFMVKAFERHGSTAIPMHMALYNIPLTIAARFHIPLVVWGENSAFEYGDSSGAHTGFRLSADWMRTYGVTHGTIAKDWVAEDLSAKDLAAYFGPSEADLEGNDLHAIFLGYYLPWDPEETHQVALKHGFKAAEKVRTGLYDFADIDDDFISIHHWMKWYKFGFTRLFDNLSLEIRNGRMTRDKAIEIIRAASDQTPKDDISSLCDFAGITADRFHAIAETFRNRKIWKRDSDGVWRIPGFLIPDWNWS